MLIWYIVSVGMYFIASTWLGSGVLPFLLITCPRYLKNSHFSILNLKPNFLFFKHFNYMFRMILILAFYLNII